MTARRRILIAWEVGGNYGHAAEIAQLLPWLDGDLDIVLAVRHPATLRSIVSDPRVRVTAAPYAPDRTVPKGDRALSYPDVMRYVGWHEAEGLAAYLESWEVLIGLVDPHVVVTQAAPTALLAAKALSIPRTLMGAGYNSPARAVPMPRFHHWEPGDAEELARREARVLDTANAALKRRGHAPLSAFREVLDVDRFLLSTLPELDHYGHRAAIEPDHPPYLGPIIDTHFGAEIAWRPDADYRVLAYLRTGNPRFETAVRALASLPRGTDVVLAVPGAPQSLADKLEDTPVRLVTGPVDFGALLPACDLGISHASPGLVANFALNGIPQIGMPNQTEQTMMAHALSASHLGLGLIGKATLRHLLQAIEVVRRSEKVAQGAAALASRWHGTDKAGPSQRAAREILSLL